MYERSNVRWKLKYAYRIIGYVNETFVFSNNVGANLNIIRVISQLDILFGVHKSDSDKIFQAFYYR